MSLTIVMNSFALKNVVTLSHASYSTILQHDFQDAQSGQKGEKVY